MKAIEMITACDSHSGRDSDRHDGLHGVTEQVPANVNSSAALQWHTKKFLVCLQGGVHQCRRQPAFTRSQAAYLCFFFLSTCFDDSSDSAANMLFAIHRVDI